MNKYTQLIEIDNGKFKCALKSKCKKGDKCTEFCQEYINAVFNQLYIFEDIYLKQNSNSK